MTEEGPSIDALVLDRAMPVIETVIRRRCRWWRSDRDDLRSEIVVRLLRRLRDALADSPAPAALENFEGYVARIASRVIDDAIRASRPEWTRLKHRVRYLVTHDERFELVDETVGLAQPRFRATRLRSAAAQSLARDVTAVLHEHGGAIALDDLVAALAERHGLTEPVLVAEGQFALASVQDPAAVIQTAQILRRLWEEITLLPPRQRIALLLSARDESGESVLRLLLATGLIVINDLAAALGGNDVAELLHDVPLADAVIAARLGLTSQQVINLRKAARDRLARRIARPR